MDLETITRNIDEFIAEMPPEEIEAMKRKAMEKYPDGVTTAEYLEKLYECFPYLQDGEH